MTYTMPEPRVGDNWTDTYRPLKDIAADIRANIKAAKKAGDLPADLKVSVRTDLYAGGGAIRVTLSGWTTEQVWTTETDAVYGWGYTLTHDAARVQGHVEQIRRSYNRDASDSMVDYFDVTYYGSTEWDWKLRP
jgi:hypothetical protein